MLHTFVFGRKDSWNMDHSLIFSSFCDAPAPNDIVKEMTEMSMYAVPEKSGPHRCKSAPTSTEMVALMRPTSTLISKV